MKSKRRSIIASLCGNVLEWYDFGLFLYLAPILTAQFFPRDQGVTHLLSVFVVFAAGFVMRPFGALLFGHCGDRKGRAWTLRCSIIAVSVLAFSVALLPTYQQIGISAAVMIMLLRLIQGLCLGGEFAGSMVYLAEIVKPDRQAFFSCLTNNGSNIGLLLATGIIGFLNGFLGHENFSTWGWRYCFVCGGAIGILGLLFRLQFRESDEFSLACEHDKRVSLPALTLWQQHRKPFLLACLLMCMTTSGCYTYMNLLSTYLHEVLHWQLSSALIVQSSYLAASLLFIPIAGYLADRVGAIPLLLVAALGYIGLSIPCYYLLNLTHMSLVLIPIFLCFCLEQGAMPITLAKLFPVEVRYSAVSFAYNLTVAIIGGTGPIINLTLIQYWHKPWFIAWHLVVASSIALFALAQIAGRKEGSHKISPWSLRGAHEPNAESSPNN